MDAVTLVRKHADEVRIYSPYTDLFSEAAEWARLHLSLKYPNSHFAPPRKIALGQNENDGLAVTDFFIPGKSDVGLLERRFGAGIPEDFLEFYRNFKEGIFVRRNLVRLYSVEEIIEETEVLREAAEIPDSIPFRVIHFASLYRSDGYEFVLRRGFMSEEWRVMLASYSTFSDLDLDMPDQNDLVCDGNFTDWVHRMIVTDCLPVRPGQSGINDDVFTERLLRHADE